VTTAGTLAGSFAPASTHARVSASSSARAATLCGHHPPRGVAGARGAGPPRASPVSPGTGSVALNLATSI